MKRIENEIRELDRIPSNPERVRTIALLIALDEIAEQLKGLNLTLESIADKPEPYCRKCGKKLKSQQEEQERYA